MKSSISKILFFVLVISIGLNIYIFFFKEKENISSFNNESSNQLPLLSKRIFINEYHDIIINFTNLRSDLRTYISNVNSDEKPVGLYFEYLPTGSSIGVNDTFNFVTASLVKVPTVMALYKKISLGQIKKTDVVTIETTDIDKLSGTLWQKGNGGKVSVNELIEMSLTNSDNTAHNIILRLVGIEEVEKVFEALDVTKNIENKSIYITPKNYSSILKSLYFSSYNTVHDSEEILEYLTNGDNTLFIASGVPKEIKVAHKFGVVRSKDSSREDTLSDCGIIYLPNRPYLLCIMTKHREQDESNDIITKISSLVYEYLNNYK